MESKQPSNADDDDQAKIQAFLGKLARLGANRRVATKERDYVVAVWVDCPSYILPAEYKSMSLPSLLDDAIGQLEKNFGATPVSTAPAGLFEECLQGSGLWRPSIYVRPGSIESSETIYGVLSTSAIIALNEKGFRLNRLTGETTALSKVAQPYEQVFQGMNTASVYESIANLAISWTSDSTQGQALKWARAFDRQSVDDWTEGPEDTFRTSLIHCMDSGKVQTQWAGEKIDHHSIVYRMVAAMLGLDHDACQKAELVLVVSVQASCIGLIRPAAIRNAQNNVTIVMSAGSIGCLAYEAEQAHTTSGTLLPIYRICGVWVPTRALALLNIDFCNHSQGTQGCVM